MKLNRIYDRLYLPIIIPFSACLLSLFIIIYALISLYQYNEKIRIIKYETFSVSNAANTVNAKNLALNIQMLKYFIWEDEQSQIAIKSYISEIHNEIDINYQYLKENYQGDTWDLVQLKNELDVIDDIYLNLIKNSTQYTKAELETILDVDCKEHNDLVSEITEDIIIYSENNISKIVENSEATLYKNMIVLIIIAFTLIITSVYLYISINREKNNHKYKEYLVNLSENLDNVFCIYNVRKKRMDYVSNNIERVLLVELHKATADPGDIFRDIDLKLAREVVQYIDQEPVVDCFQREFLFSHPKLKQEKWMKLTIVPIMEDSTLLRYILSIYDINEVKKKEVLLNAAMVNSQQANEAKTYFMSRMSHDIRNPLNSIIGMTTIAATKNITNEVNECLQVIYNSSNILLKLVNDILDLSKIENGRYTLNNELFTIEEIVQDINSIIHPQAIEKNIQFKIINDMKNYQPLIGDSLKLKQILLNLLNNAIKFTHPGGKVKLLISNVILVRERIIRIRFIVTDTGIGISKEFMDKLYLPFEQEVKESTIKNEGSGLGMSIVKSFVFLMNGTIVVKSKENRGSTFVVEIPFVIDLKGEGADLQEKKQLVNILEAKLDCTSKRFLLVDDNELNLEIAAGILKSTGAQVDYAYSGQQAIDLFTTSKEGYYDIIFMDILMPDLDGYETTKIIRNSNHNDALTIYIIALTANAFTDDISKAQEAGMNMHISKPIDIKLLYNAIKEVLFT